MTAGYRGDGLRAWKQSAQGRAYFLYDDTLPILELDAAGAVAAVNTFGGAALVSRRSGAQSTFYTFDPQGSAAQRADAAGAVISSHLFNAHGGELTAPGAGPFGYGARWGYYTDRETGLQLLTHRYYDPATGRFLTRDPIGYRGGVNLYSYVGNNPANLFDPEGTQARSDRDRLGDRYPGMDKPYQPGTPDLLGFWCDLTFGTPNPPPRPSDPNLCGSGWSEEVVPDYIGSLDMRQGCKNHDDCYTYDRPKLKCDVNLAADILRSCPHARGMAIFICPTVAPAYGAAVAVFGGSAYDDAQKNAPRFPPPPPPRPWGGGARGY